MAPDSRPSGLGDKQALREQVLDARARVPRAIRDRDSRLIVGKCIANPALRRARTVFIYVATEHETDTRALIDHCLASGKTVLVPMVRSRTEMSAVRFPGWSAMTTGRLGILTPAATTATWAEAVDLVIVPGLAFGLDGGRIGYGAGYYDRWLAAHPHTATIAVCFELQLFAHVPVTADDVPMTTIMTETRTVKLINTSFSYC